MLMIETSIFIISSSDLQVMKAAIKSWISLILCRIVHMRVTCPLVSHRYKMGKMLSRLDFDWIFIKLAYYVERITVSISESNTEGVCERIHDSNILDYILMHVLILNLVILIHYMGLLFSYMDFFNTCLIGQV